MKIKEGYVIKNLTDSRLIVPLCQPYFDSIMTVNDTGELLFNMLKEGAEVSELTRLLTSEYEVDEKTAVRDVELFIDMLRREKLLDE